MSEMDLREHNLDGMNGFTRRQVLGLMGAAGTGLAVAPGLASGAVADAAPTSAVAAPPPDDPQLRRLKQDAIAAVEARSKLVQEIVDSIFSFSELGFQEVETTAYLLGILRANGFSIEEEMAGIPTAWMATWGSGGPVVALGSDIDCIPRANQKPGVLERDPVVDPVDYEYAPGHGEGHNSGMGAVVVAGIVLKELMQRDGIQGTLKLWPGVAEELVGSKAYYVREGFFDDVDATLFHHVDSGLSTSWGLGSGNGLISLEYTFRGRPGHGASPERGRSALDAVELMAVAMEYRREHLPVQQRTHHINPISGDQPNVIPEIARTWYYLREDSPEEIVAMREFAEQAARAAAQMSETELIDIRVLGSASPQHMNRPIAEAAGANFELVGMPEWSDDDQAFARALQESAGGQPRGLNSEPSGVSPPPQVRTGGGSDDIGDISWTVPTITIRYPANVPGGGPSHTWQQAIAMATPIAHKGTTTCAKVTATTVLDLLTKPELLSEAQSYFDQEQAGKYQPLIGSDDQPAIHLNRERMARWKPKLEPFYYDPSRYDTYLEQLGIDYPGV